VKAGIVDSSSFAYPLHMGFTTNSTLYSIEYELTVKATLSGAKDLLSTQPLHVCPWDTKTCSQIITSIEKAATSRRGRDSMPRPTREGYPDSEHKRILVE
jgi:hypothetical protein